MPVALIVLAAGKGARMQSDLPKVLHKVAGAPLLVHSLRAGAALAPVQTLVVAGHGFAAVREAVLQENPTATVVLQEPQQGTGHAVRLCAPHLQDFSGDVAVLYGDTPFLQPQTLQRLQRARRGHALVVLGFHAQQPQGYGRLVMEGDRLVKIVECADASEAERAITFCNSGVVLADKAVLFALLEDLDCANAQQEYYLTDIAKHAQARGIAITAIACEESETMGVNTRAQLAEAEAAFQAHSRARLMENGVSLVDPATTWLAYDTQIGRDVVIEPNVFFGPKVCIEAGAHIRAFSYLEGCHVGSGARVGPYARLRPQTQVGTGARVGNFVEIKNTELAHGAKVNHLSYVGDAVVGEGANVGAGTITCNYDGVAKHGTHIGAGAFIGSGTMLVAPVKVGDGAMTAGGSTITQDVEHDALAIGRSQQTNKAGFVPRFLAMQRQKTRHQKK
ncbi:MAG: bifunctional UDP-N-acetylglucosamine diphosphorylase/glucosamine-1-phosphate N-acetyltransferase GlmU [Rhodobacteraceae bacterium]|nr:bifunctional UDP-N-acetylglucosamine diphosphorylase/glucosamine-1-phosphate N-acetyltransferase GlmU [Paracoccaceae bacterium]